MKRMCTFIQAVAIAFSSLSLSSYVHAAETIVSLESFQRLNKPQNQVEGREWVGLSFTTEETRGREVKDYYLEAQGRFLFRTQDYNYAVPEAYWRFQDHANQFFVGKKILDWNLGEGYWGLNNLNPQRAFQLLDNKEEGLIGLLFKRNFFGIDFDFFFSYINVPQLNPSVDIEDGKVTSTSDWTRLPPSKTIFRGQEKNIRYELIDPEIKDIVFKKSLGLRGRYQWATGALSAFAIYKPENKIRANAFVKELDDVNDTVVVVADPIVNHHAVYGIFLEQEAGGFDTYAGIDVTDPNAKIGTDFEVVETVELQEEGRIFQTDDFEILPNYVRESYFRSGMSWTNGITGMGFNFIQLLSDNIRGDDFFSDTVRFKQAIGLSFNHVLSDWVSMEADMRYDLRRKDQIVKAQANLAYQQFRAFIGLELIKSPRTDSYWSVYRANDTVYSGIGFSF